MYLAHHPQASEIFRSPITAFRAEVFDEKYPNSGKMGATPLRVDFVCIRADGSAVRLHPGKTTEAKIEAVNNREREPPPPTGPPPVTQRAYVPEYVAADAVNNIAAGASFQPPPPKDPPDLRHHQELRRDQDLKLAVP